MHPMVRSFVLAFSASALLVTLAACAEPVTSKVARSLSLDKVAEYQGKVVGPIVRGQPEDGTGFKSYELELSEAVVADDKAICGPQDVRRLPIEKEGIAPFLDKTVRFKAKAYCRENRTGTYHLTEVTEIQVIR